jgi:hypothetical protein
LILGGGICVPGQGSRVLLRNVNFGSGDGLMLIGEGGLDVAFKLFWTLEFDCSFG